LYSYLNQNNLCFWLCTFAFDYAPLLVTSLCFWLPFAFGFATQRQKASKGKRQAKAKDATFARSLTKAREATDAKAKGTKVASVAFALPFAFWALLCCRLLAAGWAMYSPACRLPPATAHCSQKQRVVKSKGA
jgi:hypothetical protein